jgi:hypothetical protein
MTRQQLLEVEVGHCLTRRVRVERVTNPVVPVSPDRRLDRPAPRPWPPRDKREVLARQLPPPYEPLQPLVRLVRAGDDEQAGGVPVEAVDDSGTALLPALRSGGGQSVRKRSAGMPGARMDDDSGGLVDYEQMLVRISDREFGRRDVWHRRDRLGRLDLDLLPASELVALPTQPAVDQYRACVEQSLGGGARTHLGEPSEVAVEPLARGFGRDDEPAQRFDGFGSRSARRRATSRIPTPVTMKLSARLNAGQ